MQPQKDLEGWQCVIGAAGGADKEGQGRQKGSGVFPMIYRQWKLERAHMESEAQLRHMGMCQASILFQWLPIHLVSEQVCLTAAIIPTIFLFQKPHRMKASIHQIFPFHNINLFGCWAGLLANTVSRFKQLFIYCACQTTSWKAPLLWLKSSYEIAVKLQKSF